MQHIMLKRMLVGRRGSGVQPPSVRVQGGALPEGAPAHAAQERPRAAVDPLMLYQTLLVLKQNPVLHPTDKIDR